MITRSETVCNSRSVKARPFKTEIILLWIVSLAALVCSSACGGSTSAGTSATVTFAEGQLAPPATVALSQTATFAATVSSDPESEGVNWSVSCTPGPAKGADCGSITPHTANGFPTTYIAPSGDLTQNSIPAGGTVTVTAASAADATKTASVSIQIMLKPIVVGFSKQPPASMKTGDTATIVIAVTNDIYAKDGTPGGADLTLICATPGACGSVAPAHTDGLAAGNGAVYTAPFFNPGGDGTVTITATSTVDPTKSASVTVSVVQAALSVTLSQTPVANLPESASTNIAATVMFDPNNAGVDWSVACASSNCGSLSFPHTVSGQITTYTAPTSVPSGNAVTITATSTTDPTKMATTTVNVTPAALRNDLFNGQFAFLMTGVKPQGVAALAGSLTADGTGKIISATETIRGDKGIYLLSGTYFIGSDGRGTITLNGAPTGMGYWNNGQQIFQITVIDSSHALIEEFDGYYNSTLHAPYGETLMGTLEKQTPTAFHAPTSGTYSFLFSGFDSANKPGFYGGLLNGSVYTFVLDRQVAGQIDSINGTATFSGNPSNGFGILLVGPYSFAYYIVDSSDFIVLATGNSGTGSDLPAGHMYSQAAISGPPVGTYVFTENGSTPLVAGNSPRAVGGSFTCASGGSLTGAVDANENGTLVSESTSGSCAMTSTSNGSKGTLTLTGSTTAQQFAVYPTATHGLLILQLDSQKSGVGTAWPQASGITAATFSGNYAAALQQVGTIDGNNGGVGMWADLVGQISADSISNITGTGNVDQFDEVTHAFWTQTPDTTVSGAFSAGTQGRFTGTLTSTPTATTQQIFYVVSSSKVLFLESDSIPGTGIFQLQNLN